MTINVPRMEDFLQPTLRALAELGGSASINEINDRAAALAGLSQAQLDKAYPDGGLSIATDRIGWARSYLKIAGLVISGGRGVWVLTDDGRQVALLPDLAIRDIVAKAAAIHNARTAAKRKAAKTGATNATRPEDDNGEGEPGQDWSEQLLATLQAMDPAAFERLAQRLLRESGFVRVEVTGKSGDGGIDGHGVLRMNLISFQVLFQCKRYKGSVAAGAVRDFRGAMQGRADKGLIITTGTFTPDARREAARDGAPAIDLIDGEALTELLRDRRLGVTIEQVVTERVTIDPAFFSDI